MFRSARYAGFDFWQAATQGATFQKVIEQLYKWSMADQNFLWNSSWYLYLNPLHKSNNK